MNKNENIRENFQNLLLRKTITKKQALEYLENQKINHDLINKLILEAENMGLIDDLTFAKLFVDGHLHWGNLKISHELGMRGISRDDIESALNESEAEIVRACEIAESLKKSGIEDKKIISRLTSRGFTKKSIMEAMKNHD